MMELSNKTKAKKIVDQHLENDEIRWNQNRLAYSWQNAFFCRALAFRAVGELND
jgi:hypothetical protein